MKEDQDRTLWMVVRQALIMITAAIEKRFNVENKRWLCRSCQQHLEEDPSSKR